MLIGIHSNGLKAYAHPRTQTWMFREYLFIMAKTWKKARYPSVGEKMNKPCYIQIMGHYSKLKINELSVMK
jgi:hypothetical protein